MAVLLYQRKDLGLVSSCIAVISPQYLKIDITVFTFLIKVVIDLLVEMESSSEPVTIETTLITPIKWTFILG